MKLEVLRLNPEILHAVLAELREKIDAESVKLNGLTAKMNDAGKFEVLVGDLREFSEVRLRLRALERLEKQLGKEYVAASVYR